MNVHELAGGLPQLLWMTPLGAADSSPSNQGIVIAIITTIGVVLAAGIAAIAATFQRPRASSSGEPNEVDMLTTQALIERAQKAEARADRAEARAETLEAWMLSNNINPHTLRRLR